MLSKSPKRSPGKPTGVAGSSGARLADVARGAGVATSTVSRALSGHPAISAATRDAVQKIAAGLGYRLPTQGRKTRKSATRIVGVVIGALHNRFMTVLLEHLHDALREAGYHVTLLIDSMNEAASLQTLRPLIDGFLDGLIIATATLDSPLVAELKRRGIPLVLVVRSVDEPGIDTVEIDNRHAAAYRRQLGRIHGRSKEVRPRPRLTRTDLAEHDADRNALGIDAAEARAVQDGTGLQRRPKRHTPHLQQVPLGPQVGRFLRRTGRRDMWLHDAERAVVGGNRADAEIWVGEQDREAHGRIHRLDDADHAFRRDDETALAHARVRPGTQRHREVFRPPAALKRLGWNEAPL